MNFDATNSLNESESSPEGITVSGHCEDLEDVVAWAKTQKFYVEPFALAGSSLGAVSVVRFAGKFPKSVNLLIPCAFPYYEKNGGLGSPQVQGIKKNGYYDKVSRSTGKVLHMTTAYVEDMEKLELSPYIEKITADTYVVIGDKDTARHLENSKALFEMLKCKKKFVLLEGVPHDLANTPENKANFTKTIDEILKKEHNKEKR